MREIPDLPASLGAQTGEIQPAGTQKFRLSRYFSVVSVVGISVVIAVLFTLSTNTMTNAMVRQESEQNVAFGRTFINALWPQYAALALRAHTIPASELVDQIENIQLRADIYRYTHALNIVKVRIYSLRGQTVFSNWDAEIGTLREAFPPIELAINQRVAAQ
jgi:hypothetical protein